MMKKTKKRAPQAPSTSDRIATVDIHDFDVQAAKHLLERYLLELDPDVCEVVVIHGHRAGNVLQDMVRHKLKSKRIKRRYLSMNPGVTHLILK